MSCENWITLKEDSDFEINDQTFQIRRKSNKRIVKESVDTSNGYIHCHLNCKKYRKNRIVANNFIPNPENYPYVDHIDKNRTNNSVSNLRWVSARMNQNNMSNQTFIDEIPEDNILVEKYGDYEFEFLYFGPDTDTFYVYNGLNYVVKPRFQNKAGNWHICVYDKYGKQRTISYRKFKKQYGLI